jgi:hypothetical protein
VTITNVTGQGTRFPAMDRLGRFEHNRWVGDKRSQVVHDIDACDAPEVIDELMASEAYLCFGPDTLAEARNRGYKACGLCDGVRAAAEAADAEADQAG